MSEMTTAIKKYWPWVLGGVVGLYFISRSGGSSTSDPLAAAYAAQAQAGVQNAAIGQAAKAAENSYNLGLATISAQKDVALAEIGANLQASQNAAAAAAGVGIISAQANYVAAQGESGLKAAQGASTMVAALNQPAVTAINAAAAENVGAFNAAATLGVGGFNAEANMIQSFAAGSVGLGGALANQTAAFTNMFESLAGSLGQMAPKPISSNSQSQAQQSGFGMIGSVLPLLLA